MCKSDQITDDFLKTNVNNSFVLIVCTEKMDALLVLLLLLNVKIVSYHVL